MDTRKETQVKGEADALPGLQDCDYVRQMPPNAPMTRFKTVFRFKTATGTLHAGTCSAHFSTASCSHAWWTGKEGRRGVEKGGREGYRRGEERGREGEKG
jgi:hypothetical protein